jgi:hypothetical protein
VRLAKALCGQLIDEEGLDALGERLTEGALIAGLHFVKATFRTDKGLVWFGNKGTPLYRGEVEIRDFNFFDVNWNWKIREWKDQPWAEFRVRMNRWDLIAQFPDLADAIRRLPPARDLSGHSYNEASLTCIDEDFVYCYEFYAKPSPALPRGRMVFYADDQCIFADADNEYREIPAQMMIPEPIQGSCLGYPKFSDLIGCQEMLDHNFSTIATNQSAFGVQTVTVPNTAGIAVQEIYGMNYLSYTPQNVPGGGKPEGLNLCATPPELFKFTDYLLGRLQQLSNLNSALRGDPPPGITAGTALATLTANAIEFLNSYQKAYYTTMDKVMMSALNAYHHFAKVPHLVTMSGMSGESIDKEYTGKDLEPIKTVKLTRTNAVMQTAGGRWQLAEYYTQTGLVKTPRDFISVLEGDEPSRMTDPQFIENQLVDQENERMLDGNPVMALATDDHAYHVLKHKALLDNIENRMNAGYVEIVMEHILEHLRLEKTTDPMLKAMTKTGQAPQQQPTPGPMPMPGGPSGGPAEALQAAEEPAGLPTSQPAQPT